MQERESFHKNETNKYKNETGLSRGSNHVHFIPS